MHCIFMRCGIFQRRLSVTKQRELVESLQSVQGVQQSQTAALSRHQEEEEANKLNKHKSNKRTKITLFPKRGNRKRTEKHSESKSEYYEVEGILLEHVEENKWVRVIAKFMLTSLWGKLAQCENLTRTEYISEPLKIFDLVINPSKLVKNVGACCEEYRHVDWEDIDYIIEAHACNNVVVAALVTAKASLKHYLVLENE